MKTISKVGAQGDVMFIRVDEIPADASARPPAASVVVAHSETGHHHVAAAENLRLYGTQDPMVMFIEADKPIDVVHERPWDTHETLRLDAGMWQVKRQRETTTEASWRAVAD